MRHMTIPFVLHKMSWQTGASPTSRLTVKLDENLKILNPRSIAAHSSHGWGFWNHAKKIKSTLGDVWDVSTPGHGGIIIVTQKKLDGPFDPVQDLTCVQGHEGYGWIPNWSKESFARMKDQGNRVVEIYVYDFEEDCDWVIPLLMDDAIAAALGKDYVTAKTALEMQEQAKQSAVKWLRPSVLAFFGLEPSADNFHIREMNQTV